MKSANPFCGITLALALLGNLPVARAEDKAKTATPGETSTTEKAKPAVTASATAPATTSTNSVAAKTAELPPAGSALLDLSSREASGTTTATPRQTGPEPTIKEPPIRSLDERGGALRYLVREPKPGNLLQLINPFAPVSWGQGGRLVNEWSPLDGAAPIPRGFRDENTHEPLSILIGWP